MINLRQLALDLNRVLRKLAYFFGTLSIKSEKWYHDLTDKERK